MSLIQLCGAMCGLVLTAQPGAAASARGGDWGAARWGMTADQVLAAFPGGARRMSPALKLADGNVVAAEIERHAVATHPFRVRFVFAGGKLALVSLRTPESTYAGPGVFEEVRRALELGLGAPALATSDQNFIDMRWVRWSVGRSHVDLKYIPGVVVILHHPRGRSAPVRGPE